MKMLTLLGIFIFSFSAFAMNGRTTYQAKIVKPDGYPLEAASVTFKFSVLDAAASCVLYSETYSAVDMRSTSGLISFALGNGVRDFPASGTTAVFSNVFDNSINSMPCQTPGIYNPLPTDARRIVMQFNDGNGWQTLPAMTINSVPYAMYATKSNDSRTLNGKADTAFVETSTLAALNCTATQAIKFNNATFSCIEVPASGSGGITSVTTSGSVLSTGGTASAPVISIQAATISQDGYLTSLDYAEFKAKLSASSTEIINTLGYTPVSSSTVASQIASSTLAGDVSGNPGSNTVDSVGGKSSSQISASVDDTLAATASATADTIVKRNSSGNVTVADLYASATKINYIDIYKPLTSFNIRLQAPTSLSANYVLNLPTTSGTIGQVLSTDGSGNLSWISPTTGSVVSVSATAPLASTGGSNPTISIAQANSTTDGYLSFTDWNTFNNKQQATSAAIIATLGYTPADNAASGTYAQKANNLSDLTNIPQARTNLGLGTLAVGNSIDLGSASATGIIADARLQTQSNVSSGTQYTKVTVDGKGRVTSGAQLSSSDVTTALGFTPADNAASGTYAQKANNLSDLTNIPQARTNLGLGTFATASTIDLGSASATGTLNIARLPSFIGDATIAAASNTIILSNSGVTAGTYTKVTVDTKGRVTSSSVLNSSDVTTALGYTPATSTTLAASFVQKTGDTMTGVLNLPSNGLAVGSNQLVVSSANVGIGVLNPTAALSLKAGTTTNAPLKFTSGTLLSSAQSGTVEYDGSQLYFTDGSNIRRALATNSSPGSFDNTSSISNTSGNITLSPNNITGSVIVNSSAASISSGTGALVVNGGVGIAGSVNAAGNLNLTGSATIGQSLSLSSMTSGSLLFAGASGLVSEDNSRLFWDGSNKRLGLGTNSPAQTLSVSGSSYFSGNVGVGITAPNAKLQIVGDGSNDLSILNLTPTTGKNWVLASENNGDFSVVDRSISVRRYTATTSGSHSFIVGPNSGAFEALKIDGSSGNIGIGTSSPTERLHVSGNIVTDGTTPRLWWNSAKTYGVGYNNSTRLQFITNGSVGAEMVTIGTTDAQLRMQQYSSGAGSALYPALSFANDFNSGIFLYGTSKLGFSTSGTTQMVVESNGNVGVGTNNPGANLHVMSDSLPTVLIGTSSATQGALYLGNSNHGLIRGPGGTVNFTPLQNDLTLFNAAGNIYLANGNNGGEAVQRLTVTTIGNVGVGTSAPTERLTVGAGKLAIINTAAWDHLSFYHSGANAYYDVGGAENGLIIRVDGSGGAGYPAVSYTEVMRLMPSGNVGIGTSSPLSILTVTGARQSATIKNTISTFDSQAFNSDVGAGIGMGGKINASGTMAHFGLVGARKENNISDDISGYLVFETRPVGGSLSEKMRINSVGNLGIGTTAPSQKLHVVGDARIQGTVTDCYIGNGSGGTSCSSDARLKENIKPIPYALEKVISLKGVEFDWNHLSQSHGRHDIGVIAQDVEKVFPTAVITGDDGYKKVDYAVLVAPLIQAFKQFYKLVLERFEGHDRQIASIVESKADRAEIEVLKKKAAEVDEVKAENAALKAYLCSKDPNASICK